MTQSEIEWGYNCLTLGVHHGRPEALWNLPLLQATVIFRMNDLEQIVITRIYNDAMQYVEHNRSIIVEQVGTDERTKMVFTQEWANQVKQIAEKKYLKHLKHKLGELTRYYNSPIWRQDIDGVIERIKEDKLGSSYQPLHSHDSINMLCRIIGVSSSREVDSVT